ncbi:hypothetical protein K435DRAFT_629019, partial [Dendrothele bispora CBS 962.96]
LFPYGTGIFEDPLRSTVGFKPVPLYLHVRHCLQLADKRFTQHLSFIFVMHNIMLLRRSSYQSRLAVQRSWWNEAAGAMEKIDVRSLECFRDHLLERKRDKVFTPLKGRNEQEEAIVKLLRHVQHIDEHFEGSMGNVSVMREEIRALSQSSGTPSLFFTLNPADGHNPITSFLAGKDINIEAPFSNPDSRFTWFDRMQTLASNPVAGAQFFHLMVDEFIGKFLGTKRPDKRGVFGRVKHYYGVVE